MQLRRPPVAPVLPLSRRNSSILSATSPRTPRNSRSPNFTALYLPSANRKSTDSWNSSNHGDDQEWEWKTEQTLLLSRTLDALPAHLLTPFNGAVPPSNLLDKIARGVAQAKGAEEWPHSVRATRLKLMELARIRDKEATREARRRRIIREETEDEDDYLDSPSDVLQPTTNTLARRPYKESSMDSMTNDKLDIKNNDSLARVSLRLQRAERCIPSSSYRTTQSSSPPKLSPLRPTHTLTPSTPSSSTLYTTASSVAPSRPPGLRRSASSTLSNASDFSEIAADPRPQQVRRSESFCAPSLSTLSGAPDGRRQVFKRAPSFGAVAAVFRSRAADPGFAAGCPSSDEEEKSRSRTSKKSKRAAASLKIDTDIVMESSPAKAKSSGTAPSTPVTAKPLRKNLQRNPSIFGAELPQPMQPPLLPAAPIPTTEPTTPRKLRRMRATSFASGPARRISFGSVEPRASTEECEEFEAGLAELGGQGLGSAFQLA